MDYFIEKIVWELLPEKEHFTGKNFCMYHSYDNI